MSLAMMAQVWQLDVPPEAKFILLAYADEAHVWPPEQLDIPRLAHKTGYTQAVVAQIMRTLAAVPGLLAGEGEG